MRYIFVLFFVLMENFVGAQDTVHTTGSAGLWPTYGYVALGVIVLAVVIFMLIRKQHRKFNE